MPGAPDIPRERAQAVLTIDLGALASNWRALRDRVGAAECAAVVKANAYGVGLERAVGALRRAGCQTFFVAHASEGARARSILGDESSRVYALNGLTPGAGPAAARALSDFDLRPVLSSRAQIAAWRDHALATRASLQAALQFDTGMNRLGVAAADIADIHTLIETDPAAPGVHVDLVMSHFVSSEIPDDALNARQIADFAAIARAFPGARASLANSSGIFLPDRPFHDLVRPGYALYGGNPTPGRDNPMRPVVRLEAPILRVVEIAAGETVGYNAQWTARRPTRIATIGVGYADGLPRGLMATDARPGGAAILAGANCPFAGRVSMDLTVIDATDAPPGAAAPGAMVELLGDQIGIDEMGRRAGTIGYEILTSLGQRYHRVYI